MSDQNQPPRPQRPPPVRPSLTRPQRLELQASMRAQGELQPRPVAATAPARPGGPPPTGPQMPGPTRPSTARPQAPGAQGPRMTSPDDQRMRIAGPQTAGLGDPRLRLGGPQTAGPGDPRLRLGGPQTAGLGDPRLRLGGPLPIAQGDPRALGAIPKVRKPAVEQLERGVQAVSIEGHSSGSGGSGSGGSGDSKGRGGGVKNPMPTSCLPSNFKTKQGRSGQPVDLLANYFRVEAKTDWILYQYRVDFSVDEDRNVVRRAIVNRLKDQIGEVFFDGTIIWSVRVLMPHGQTREFSVDHEGQRINVRIRNVGQVTEAEQKNQFYNLVIRRCMSHMELVEIKRIHYDPQLKNVLQGQGLEIWPGYSTSMRQFERSSLICLELTNKILRLDSVLDFMTKILRKGGSREDVTKALLGRYVMTRYNSRTYKIDEISWSLKPTMTFDKKGVPTKYVAYFQDRYKLQVRDLRQPLLVSNPTERERRNGHNTPSHLVPELCQLCGLSDEEKGQYQIMAAVAEFTRINPPRRVEMLRSFNRRIRETPAAKNTFANWNLELNPDLLRLPGRLLDPERIFVGNRASVTYKSENAEWQSVFRNKMLVPGSSCKSWFCIYPGVGTVKVKSFITEIINSSNRIGFTMSKPFEVVLENPSTPKYIESLHSSIKEGPQIVMVVVPNNKGDVYHAIKKVAYVETGTSNQVVTLTVLNKAKNLGAIAQKVSAQMCAKLGGQLWGLNIPPETDSMVVGYDTWHDSLHNRVSVGAIVCSSNPGMTQFLSYAIRHDSGEEMCSKFQKNLKTAMDRWKKLNGKYPKRIIIYRDGVGEGQLNQLLQVEVNPLKNMVEKTEEGMKFTYIVVSKRIMTRFFEMKSPTAEPTNPCSGTVVDDIVTLPERYDFFLVSQSVRVGTINPTSYYVVTDTSGFPPDVLQRLSYKLTHMYYNWPGTVRVPAVCQYAHKLAYLVGESLHQDPNEALNEVLYYL